MKIKQNRKKTKYTEMKRSNPKIKHTFKNEKQQKNS